MFYGSHGLHGRSQRPERLPDDPAEDERYDLAHFEFVMRGHPGGARGAARARRPDLAVAALRDRRDHDRLHQARRGGQATLNGLAAYSASRPPHSEGLAVTIASYLADETQLPNINLLHLTSRKALEAAHADGSRRFPHVDFRREVTIGHLMADIDTASGIGGKVNPPIRPREDVEACGSTCWPASIDWVVSDHACCRDEMKFGEAHASDVFAAKSGFGGTEYLLPALVSEGSRRGLSYSDGWPS